MLPRVVTSSDRNETKGFHVRVRNDQPDQAPPAQASACLRLPPPNRERLNGDFRKCRAHGAARTASNRAVEFKLTAGCEDFSSCGSYRVVMFPRRRRRRIEGLARAGSGHDGALTQASLYLFTSCLQDSLAQLLFLRSSASAVTTGSRLLRTAGSRLTAGRKCKTAPGAAFNIGRVEIDVPSGGPPYQNPCCLTPLEIAYAASRGRSELQASSEVVSVRLVQSVSNGIIGVPRTERSWSAPTLVREGAIRVNASTLQGPKW